MRLSSRKLLDRSFSALGFVSIVLMGVALLVVLVPILKRGSGAFIFKGTVEHRRVLVELFDAGHEERLRRDLDETAQAREPVYAMLHHYREHELSQLKGRAKREAKLSLREVEEALEELLGPMPGEKMPVLPRQRYGQSRWERALVKRDELLFVESWDYSDTSGMGKRVLTERKLEFADSSLAPLFDYVDGHLEEMLQPRLTFYGGFLIHSSVDSHIFGGIWPEVVGTLYLTAGAMLVALPLGVLAAIYFAEYAKPGRVISLLRSCVSTLAGVPSIVFGLFGLAFFINTIGISSSKSVAAGALTLGLLILPTIIRAAEEAILAVPVTYKEAALGLGASRWHTVMTVVLPAALPGILTGAVISMGRAAGETAPIIFTAAVSVGPLVKPWEVLTKATPALPWNIYNLCTEHEAVDEIRHVQFGMVTVLILLVLLLNVAAIVMRARVSKKLRG